MSTSELRVLSFLRVAHHTSSDEISNYYLGLIRHNEVLIVKTLSLGAFYSDPELGRLLYQRFIQKITRELNKFMPFSHESIVAVQPDLQLCSRGLVSLSFQPFGNLLQWVSTKAYLDIYSICVAMQRVFKGLEHMHRLGFAHGNLKMTNILFKTFHPDSACISMDSSVTSEMLKLCSPIPLELQYCPPELKDDMLRLQRSWPSVSDGLRNDQQLAEVDRILLGTPERDVWCVGIIMHILLTGVDPFGAYQLGQDISALRFPERKCTHSIFSTISSSVVGQLEKFLHSDPKYRAKAEDGALCLWFSDKQTTSDNRNILYRNEDTFLGLLLRMNFKTLFPSGRFAKVLNRSAIRDG